MKSIHTERLEIRPFTLNDVTKIFKLSQEPALGRWIPDQVYDSLLEAEETLAFLMNQYKSKNYPLVMAVVIKETQVLIGHVGLSEIPQGIEIGYAIGSDYQKMGYGKEAVRAYTENMMKRLGIKKVFGVVDAKNTGSRKLLESIGYINHGIDIIGDFGQIKDKVVYSYQI